MKSKCIVLAKMGKRVGAAVIDLVITLVLSFVIFFSMVLPAAINVDTYTANEKGMRDIMQLSGLYEIYQENNTFYSELKLDIVTADPQFKNNNIEHENLVPSLNSYEYKKLNRKVYVIDSLVRFYTEDHLYGENNKPIFIPNKLTVQQMEEKLKIGSDKSNIASLTLNPETNTFEISMIDKTKQKVTVEFIAQLIKPDQFDDNEKSASELVTTSEPYVKFDENNRNMMLGALLYIFPVMFGISAIFYLVIPMSMKNGETLGKLFLGLGVLTQDGYVLKKTWYIPRFLAFYFIELALGILTFGGLFLVSYIMFCFTKKRRSLHDFCGNSVVIDKKDSVWFLNRDEEYKYEYKTRIDE